MSIHSFWKIASNFLVERPNPRESTGTLVIPRRLLKLAFVLAVSVGFITNSASAKDWKYFAPTSYGKGTILLTTEQQTHAITISVCETHDKFYCVRNEAFTFAIPKGKPPERWG